MQKKSITLVQQKYLPHLKQTTTAAAAKNQRLKYINIYHSLFFTQTPQSI